ncbi:hypothetical protein PPL_02741 [Heterostelium album PN500]|uniref:Ankyrin repeat protein n=1 Tax=Heterostelium pallidum (strain ATCC 26659 / Pp 5 / PN500) TaxID=670386 RepID=D3B2X7_HETP5|nr:hypothetical protein PPL_02741 [Heterostelium album PN500]EFA83675.1 hypothetical protein PPL_02741 [Heterostelium album PN500]|eukprot:XP_020435792.1 hypothetical protein PPL_02741 [Heterostelium album PN500]
MDKQLIISVLKNVVVCKLIVNHIKEIARWNDEILFKYHYQWSEVIKRPYVLATHGYLPEFKACLERLKVNGVKRLNLSIFFGVIKGGSVEMMKYLLDHYDIEQRLKEELESTTTTTTVKEKATTTPTTQVQDTLNDALEYASKNGRLDIINYLMDRLAAATTTTSTETSTVIIKWDFNKMLAVAPLSGDLDVVKFFSRKFDEDPSSKPVINTFNNALNNSARIGRIDLIQWLAENRGHELSKSDMMKYAVLGGHLQTVEYLLAEHKQLQRPKNDEYMKIASLPGKPFAIFKLLREHKFTLPNRMLETAAKTGNLEVLHLLSDDKDVRWESPMDAAIEGGQLNVVKWMNEKYPNEKLSPRRIEEAAKRGHLEMLKWIYENRTERCESDVMDDVVKNGFFETLKWLDQNTTQQCTANSLPFVIKQGNLELLQFLHERNDGDNNRFKFSTDTMDTALRYQQYDVMKWLHANRTEGCTETALHYAIYSERLDIAQWLLENIPKYNMKNININNYLNEHLENLFECDSEETLEWLLNNIDRVDLPTEKLLEYQAQLAEKFPESSKAINKNYRNKQIIHVEEEEVEEEDLESTEEEDNYPDRQAKKLQNISRSKPLQADTDSDLSDLEEASSDEHDSEDGAVEAKKKSYRPRLCPVCHKPKKAKRGTAEHECKGPCKSLTICGREDKHPAEYKKAKELEKLKKKKPETEAKEATNKI